MNQFIRELIKIVGSSSNRVSRESTRIIEFRYGHFWLVFAWDEMNREKIPLHYFNNNDLVIEFHALEWHVLIYGIDPSHYKD